MIGYSRFEFLLRGVAITCRKWSGQSRTGTAVYACTLGGEGYGSWVVCVCVTFLSLHNQQVLPTDSAQHVSNFYNAVFALSVWDKI